MECYNVIWILLLEFIRVSSASYLACYSCIYNAALRDGTSIMTSSSWLPRMRHQNRTRHGYSDVMNTRLCGISAGKHVREMPVRICPRIDGYQVFCHREYVMENDVVTHVSRDCYYSNQHKQIFLASETFDPVTKVTKRRQQQICTASLCNQDENLVARYVTMATQKRSDEFKTLEDRILNRGRRTPTPAPEVYHLDNDPSNRRQGNGDASPSNDEDDRSRFDDDAENDDEDNYYNADGSGVNIEFDRWYPTDFPNSATAELVTSSAHLARLLAVSVSLWLYITCG